MRDQAESPRAPGLRRSRLRAPEGGTAHAAVGRWILRAASGRARLAGDRGGGFPPDACAGSWRVSDDGRGYACSPTAILRSLLLGLRPLRCVALGRAYRAHATSARGARDARVCPAGPGSVLRDGSRDAGAGGVRTGEPSSWDSTSRGECSPAVCRGAAGGPLRHLLGTGRRLSAALQAEVFDVVACAYALYELKGPTEATCSARSSARSRLGEEFLAMEHEVPSRPLPRFLFSLRLAAIGAEGARAFLGGEIQEIGRVFSQVHKDVLPPGKSKILTGHKGRPASGG